MSKIALASTINFRTCSKFLPAKAVNGEFTALRCSRIFNTLRYGARKFTISDSSQRDFEQVLRQVLRLLIFAVLFFEVSCSSDPSSDPNFYNRTGFDVGASRQEYEAKQALPQNAVNTNYVPTQTATKVAPDYYYRQPMYPNQGYAPQYQSQQYMPPYAVPYYQQPPAPYYQPSPYPPQAVPNSRFYSNPYAIPPSNQPMQRYDVDQFYVPPAVYRDNAEPQQALPKAQDQSVVRY